MVHGLLYSAGSVTYRPNRPIARRQDYAVNLFGIATACEQLTKYWIAAGVPGAIVRRLLDNRTGRDNRAHHRLRGRQGRVEPIQ
jgi:hypothetical protein